MQLNYFGAVKLIIGLLPHMRERGSGTSSTFLDRRAGKPAAFSAYVASKARSTPSRAWSPPR